MATVLGTRRVDRGPWRLRGRLHHLIGQATRRAIGARNRKYEGDTVVRWDIDRPACGTAPGPYTLELSISAGGVNLILRGPGKRGLDVLDIGHRKAWIVGAPAEDVDRLVLALWSRTAPVEAVL